MLFLALAEGAWEGLPTPSRMLILALAEGGWVGRIWFHPMRLSQLGQDCGMAAPRLDLGLVRIKS